MIIQKYLKKQMIRYQKRDLSLLDQNYKNNKIKIQVGNYKMIISKFNKLNTKMVFKVYKIQNKTSDAV